MMVLWRRQPAGACLGGLAGLSARSRAPRRAGRHRLSRAHLPQADAQLHLVGEPQRCRRTQYLPGRLSRARQYRFVRPQRSAADGRSYHQSDGTAWMAMYTLNLMRIALELATENHV